MVIIIINVIFPSQNNKVKIKYYNDLDKYNNIIYKDRHVLISTAFLLFVLTKGYLMDLKATPLQIAE